MAYKSSTSREYAIFIKGFEHDVQFAFGKNAGEAKYKLWMRISDCGYWDNFFEFAKSCRCLLVDNLLG